MNTIWWRASVPIITAGLVTMATTTPAGADDAFPYGGVAQTSQGYALNDADGQPLAAAIVTLKQDNGGGKVLAYSLESDATVDDRQRVYEEADADEAGFAALGEVRWILDHGYPATDAATLAADSGADLTDISEVDKTAYTATQAAIWSLTDKVEWDIDITDQDDTVDTAVTTMAKYLVDNAQHTGEVANEVRIDGPESGAQDGAVGPFTASGPREGGTIALSAEGGDPVATDGSPLDEIASGDEFYIDPDSAVDSLTINARATDAPPAGLVLLATQQRLGDDSGGGQDSAAIALAEPGKDGAAARTTVDIGSQGEHSVLPVTGSGLSGMLLLGIGLVATGGFVAFFAARPGRAADLFGHRAGMFHPPKTHQDSKTPTGEKCRQHNDPQWNVDFGPP